MQLSSQSMTYMLKENSYSQNISVQSESLIINYCEHKESNKKRENEEYWMLTEINHNIVEIKTLYNDIKAKVDNLIASSLTNKLNEVQNTKLMKDEQNKIELTKNTLTNPENIGVLKEVTSENNSYYTKEVSDEALKIKSLITKFNLNDFNKISDTEKQNFFIYSVWSCK